MPGTYLGKAGSYDLLVRGFGRLNGLSRLNRLVWVGKVGLGLTLVAVLLIVLNPTTVDAGHEDVIVRVLRELHQYGVPARFGYSQLEFSANIVMFLPLGFFAGLAVGSGVRARWWMVLVSLPAFSALIELTQHFFLPGRFATVSDVVANSIGGVVGVMVARGLVRRALATEQHRAPHSAQPAEL